MKNKCILALIGSLVFTACQDDGNVDGYDPTQPVVLTDFTPKEGGVRTKLFITGSNFGTDTTRVHLTIGGQATQIIGMKNDEIYCMVPARAYDGDIRLTVTNADGGTSEYTFDETFAYTAQTTVGTLFRQVDQDGNTYNADGSFDVASIRSADWMIFDPHRESLGTNQLFTANWYDGLRLVDFEEEEVSTLFGKTGQYHTIYSFSFTADGDTLLWVDDNGNASGTDLPNIFYALRSNNFRRLYPYNYGPCSYGCVYMDDGTVFYSSWTNGAVYRMERTGTIPNIDNNPTECFRLSTIVSMSGSHTKMTLHPSKKYMYMYTDSGYGVILRSNYNEEERMFEFPTIIAGSMTERGCTEGTGSSARFYNPWAGVFVYNREYEETRTDGELYDFYFTDYDNYCLWKLTPDGVATIVAGRSNYTSDNSYSGYVDGDPLTEARFRTLGGLCYDETTETFYMGDIGNGAIRYMRVE